MFKQAAKLVFILFGVLFVAAITQASTTNGTIDANNSFAWGEKLGWINFAPTSTGNVYNGLTITDTAITGFAWSRVYGWINFAPTNGGVTNNCQGQLGGYAWSSQKGWINMGGVVINSSSVFTGIAGDVSSTAGRINFACTNCLVKTDWKQCALRTAVCGDGVTATGEACDNGSNNGACPASCSTTCTVNSCKSSGGGGGGGGYIVTTPTTTTSTVIDNTTTTTEIIYKSDGKIADKQYVHWFNNVISKADIVRDGVVDIFDFNNLMVNWYTSGKKAADVNSDKIVDIFDFNTLMVYWGKSEVEYYNKVN